MNRSHGRLRTNLHNLHARERYYWRNSIQQDDKHCMLSKQASNVRKSLVANQLRNDNIHNLPEDRFDLSVLALSLNHKDSGGMTSIQWKLP